MDTTTLVAWIGALTGTSSLAWEFIKWRLSGPRLKAELIRDTAVSNAVLASDKFAWFRITNISPQRKVTLNKLILKHYKTRSDKRQYNQDCEPEILADEKHMLPKVLSPGEQWNGLIEQNDEFKSISGNGLFYCEIYHSLNDKPLIKRVIVREPYFAAKVTTT